MGVRRMSAVVTTTRQHYHLEDAMPGCPWPGWVSDTQFCRLCCIIWLREPQFSRWGPYQGGRIKQNESYGAGSVCVSFSVLHAELRQPIHGRTTSCRPSFRTLSANRMIKSSVNPLRHPFHPTTRSHYIYYVDLINTKYYYVDLIDTKYSYFLFIYYLHYVSILQV